MVATESRDWGCAVALMGTWSASVGEAHTTVSGPREDSVSKQVRQRQDSLLAARCPDQCCSALDPSNSTQGRVKKAGVAQCRGWRGKCGGSSPMNVQREFVHVVAGESATASCPRQGAGSTRGQDKSYFSHSCSRA